MIAHLQGTLFKKTTQSIIINVGGVGYEVSVPLSTFYSLPETQEEVSLEIHTHVKDDSLTLFGFNTALEKSLFLMLISVSGIGPKLSVNILSGIGPGDLLEAIARGDAVRLQAIPGIGKKTAERIVLELKDRATKTLGEMDAPSLSIPHGESTPLIDDALSALVNLGYSSRSARTAVEGARSHTGEMTLEGLIREALKILS
ncbi:MAG: Holliday junction branch migration protein RuvA [Deltaproteobacteria bacterium]|nr:Holliday junction branch migration protein RuvA [Deltaproteobacteria bacterium]MBW2048986.1 Holliday junction branch migration protein RuvA [Deltaproteobacteria bacterium]MBW2111549.1 Holliday junction branch migration protein RuvA [Deltaproteobacteria bacterium]MBW2352818.1 Holliday junction branch migration protein RuvA [Deltaproteobacteria bacterium]